MNTKRQLELQTSAILQYKKSYKKICNKQSDLEPAIQKMIINNWHRIDQLLYELDQILETWE